MAEKRLSGIKMGDTWTSYIAAVYGSLQGSALWTGDLSSLMGMTGVGFHYIVHNQACASSATVYDWQNEHLSAMDRIGIHSQSFYFWNSPGMNTFNLIRKDAVQAIKASIDRGIPVVLWAPTNIMEFGIVDGYDDSDEVFFVKACVDDNPDPLLYANLGCSEVPILFYQIFKDRVEVNHEKIFRDSLTYALAEWEKDYHIDPCYATGIKAYENLVRSLKNGDFQEFGLTYLMAVYADAKTHIAKYLQSVSKETSLLKGLAESAEQYGRVAKAFQQVTKLVPFQGATFKGKRFGIVDRGCVPQLIELLQTAKADETQAMLIVKDALF